jgi:hypothetical protein
MHMPTLHKQTLVCSSCIYTFVAVSVSNEMALVWCRRDFTSCPQPIEKLREKYPLLNRHKEFGPCNCCRGAKRQSADTRPDSQVTADCKDDEKQGKWMTIVLCYEAQKNGNAVEDVPGFEGPSSRDGPSVIVAHDESVSLVSQVHIANFWPTVTVMETFGLMTLPDGIFEDEDAFGVMCLGVWRDASTDPLELPRRVKRIFKEKKDTAKRQRIMDRSKDHIREGQGRDAWKIATDRVSARIQSNGEDDGLQLVADRVDGSDGDDDDFCLMTTATKPTASSSGRASSSTLPSTGRGAVAGKAGVERACKSPAKGKPTDSKSKAPNDTILKYHACAVRFKANHD